MMKMQPWIILIIAVFPLFSCTTQPEDRYQKDNVDFTPERVWNGTIEDRKQKWTIVLGRNGADGREEGARSFQINATPFSWGGSLQGVAFPDTEGRGWILHIDELIWFNTWAQGWTEVRFSAWGSFRLESVNQGWRLKILEPPHVGTVNEASIRYRNDYFYGDEARNKVQNRWNRIEALTDFLRSVLRQRTYTQRLATPGNENCAFENDLRSLVFPELYGYRKEYPDPGAGRNDFHLAENYRWNTLYSLTYLPEKLRKVRDTGTLLRDYEESPGLIYLSYLWSSLWDEVVPRLILKEEEKKI